MTITTNRGFKASLVNTDVSASDVRASDVRCVVSAGDVSAGDITPLLKASVVVPSVLKT